MAKLRNASVYIAVVALWCLELSLQIYLNVNAAALELGALAYWLPMVGLIVGQFAIAPLWLVFGSGSWLIRLATIGGAAVATASLALIASYFHWSRWDSWLVEMGIGWLSAAVMLLFAGLIRWRGGSLRQLPAVEAANPQSQAWRFQLADAMRWMLVTCVLLAASQRKYYSADLLLFSYLVGPVGFALQGLTVAWALLWPLNPLVRYIDWLYTAPAIAFTCVWFIGEEGPAAQLLIFASWFSQSVILWTLRHEGYRFLVGFELASDPEFGPAETSA